MNFFLVLNDSDQSINKCRYTSKMLLAAIDERHRGTYDFIYLPIDFKASFSEYSFNSVNARCRGRNHPFLFPSNLRAYLIVINIHFPLILLQNKCNVGYAFINMIDPSQIITFYQVGFVKNFKLMGSIPLNKKNTLLCKLHYEMLKLKEMNCGRHSMGRSGRSSTVRR